MRSFVVPLGVVATVALFAGCSGKSESGSTGPGGKATGGAAGNGADASGAGNAGTSTGPAESGAGGAGGAGSGGAAASIDGGTAEGGESGAETGGAGAGAGTSHLVAWKIEADGTDPLVMGIYDSQAKAHCRFLSDSAGELRCLPWPLASFKETTSFSDAACTKRIYLTDDTVGPTWVDRATALPLPRTACSPRRYAVGTLSALPADAPHYGGTPCAAIQPPPKPGFGQVEMTVVETQATDRWEKGARVDGPLIGGRMRVKQIEAADGTRFVDDFSDEHWDKPCHLVASGSGVFCQATAALSITGVEGAQCMGPPVWRAHACDDPAFVGASPGPTLALGPLWSGPVSHSGKGCTPVPASSTIDGPDLFYTAGAPLNDAVMAAQSWQAKGTGRLRLRGLLDGDGNVATFPAPLLWSELDSAVITGAHARYFDSVANTPCNPIRTPEGLLRCVPTSVAFIQTQGAFGFSDDQCSLPAFVCPNYAATCPGVVAATVTLDANGEIRATSLNATRALTTSFTSPTGTCTPSTVTTLGLFALGAEQAWTQYPAFTESNGRAPDAP